MSQVTFFLTLLLTFTYTSDILQWLVGDEGQTKKMQSRVHPKLILCEASKLDKLNHEVFCLYMQVARKKRAKIGLWTFWTEV